MGTKAKANEVKEFNEWIGKVYESIEKKTEAEMGIGISQAPDTTVFKTETEMIGELLHSNMEAFRAILVVARILTADHGLTDAQRIQRAYEYVQKALDSVQVSVSAR